MNNEERILEVLAAMRADMESMKANMSEMNCRMDSLTEKVDTLTEYSEETRDAANYVAEWVENVASANPKLHKLRP